MSVENVNIAEFTKNGFENTAAKWIEGVYVFGKVCSIVLETDRNRSSEQTDENKAIWPYLKMSCSRIHLTESDDEWDNTCIGTQNSRWQINGQERAVIPPEGFTIKLKDHVFCTVLNFLWFLA